MGFCGVTDSCHRFIFDFKLSGSRPTHMLARLKDRFSSGVFCMTLADSIPQCPIPNVILGACSLLRHAINRSNFFRNKLNRKTPLLDMLRSFQQQHIGFTALVSYPWTHVGDECAFIGVRKRSRICILDMC